MQVASFVVVSFTAPTGMITAIYIWAILQIVGCYQIYCRPTFGFAYNYVIRYCSASWCSQSIWYAIMRCMTSQAIPAKACYVIDPAASLLCVLIGILCAVLRGEREEGLAGAQNE